MAAVQHTKASVSPNISSALNRFLHIQKTKQSEVLTTSSSTLKNLYHNLKEIAQRQLEAFETFRTSSASLSPFFPDSSSSPPPPSRPASLSSPLDEPLQSQASTPSLISSLDEPLDTQSAITLTNSVSKRNSPICYHSLLTTRHSLQRGFNFSPSLAVSSGSSVSRAASLILNLRSSFPALFTTPLSSSMVSVSNVSAPYSLSLARSYSTYLEEETPIERLYQQADDRPQDAARQAALYKALLAREPFEVVKRYESQQYASNDECTKLYLEALVFTKRIRQTNLKKILDTKAGDTSHDGFAYGSEDNPMHITQKAPSIKEQFWRLLRTLIILISVFAIVQQFMEDRGLGGKGVGVTAHQEIKPEQGAKMYTFDDVQGADEAKEELQDVVSFLRNPGQFTRLGGKLPKGVLLMGPPGTGKTLLARAVAGEAGVPFFFCSGSEFDEMFVGVGARRVRELFAAAKRKAPCIVFMDEIDAIGSKRSAKDQHLIKMTLNQLLVELDGFSQTDNVIVIAATNFPEMLDQALVRPGRFDTHIKVPLPDVRGRENILKVHAKDVPIAQESDLWTIARGTPGFSGADLANLVNQAALKASRENLACVDIESLEWAKDKILMGAERKKAVITEKDRKMTAYHEAGHALCALTTPGSVPVYKATIVPRGNALGMVTQLPEDDTNSISLEEMQARLVVCMGGRAAEEKIFGKKNVSSGAASDLTQATRLARAMVTKYGLSEKVGPIDVEAAGKISAQTQQLIDAEIKRLLEGAMTQATRVLQKHESVHHRLAEALLEYETLTADEMHAILKGKKLPALRK
eukprot:m.122185 g.122185  ORF g.122185 m.122185 type:complete len:808 (-) comp23315_c0_seq2:81-2504(-)